MERLRFRCARIAEPTSDRTLDPVRRHILAVVLSAPAWTGSVSGVEQRQRNRQVSDPTACIYACAGCGALQQRVAIVTTGCLGTRQILPLGFS
jgi:hypothetical protein